MLTEILNNYNIARQVVGAFHDHKSVEEYRRYAQILGNTREHINALKKENPMSLGKPKHRQTPLKSRSTFR